MEALIVGILGAGVIGLGVLLLHRPKDDAVERCEVCGAEDSGRRIEPEALTAAEGAYSITCAACGAFDPRLAWLGDDLWD